MEGAKLFSEFFNSEKAGGILLVAATVISLVLANLPLGEAYTGFWNTLVLDHTLVHWINDGLMTIFFLLIGLELEREIYAGELSRLKKASLPIFAAIGGMFVPAAIFITLNFGKSTQTGAGIPMATDIAFAIGILSLLGSRVPSTLKIFLTALAVIDDLGAILVIAVFYSHGLSITYLSLAAGIFLVLVILNRLKVNQLLPYLLGGAAMWYCMLHSGVHATITGVLLAFAIPFGDGGENTPSFKLQHFLHKPVAFLILPVFALANTCIPIASGWYHSLVQSSSIGIMAGLVIGKPVGILLFSWLGVILGWCVLPTGIKWKNILGAGILGGIGFTMSIFITLLAFNDNELISISKISILAASLVAGITGYLFLRFTLDHTE